MSEAIERPPGGVHLVTRRCHDRLFRFVPDEEMRGAFHVVLQGACERTGVKILGFCAMSNHLHAVVEDVEGRLGEWEAQVNGLLARYVNAVQGRDSHVWDAQEDNAIRLEGLGQIADKVAYVMANPVRAGLVYSPSAWPGAITRVEDLGTGRGLSAKRPSRFFRKKGPVAAEAELPSHAPTGVTAEEFQRAVKAALEEKLAEARAAVKKSRRAYLGVDKVQQQSPFSAPKTKEQRNVGEAAQPRPRFLGSTPESTHALIAGHAHFLEEYADRLQRFCKGERDVVFPAGTYKMHHVYGASRASLATQAAALAAS